MQTFWIIVSALAVNAAALALMFFYFRKLIRNTLGLEEILDKARTEVGGMIAELNQSADRNVSLLEDRIEKAQAFIKSADKRFEVIQRAGAERTREKDIYDKLSRARPAAPVNELPRDAPRPGEQERPRPQQGRQPPEPAVPEASAPGAQAMPEIRPSAEPVETGMSAPERVIRLWEKGISTQLIASRLSMTIAEVDLIVAMEEQRRLLGK